MFDFHSSQPLGSKWFEPWSKEIEKTLHKYSNVDDEFYCLFMPPTNLSTRARFLYILKTIFWVIIRSCFEHSKKTVREAQSWNYQESPWDTTMWLQSISEYWPETNVSSMRYHFKSITQLQIYNSLKNILWPFKIRT